MFKDSFGSNTVSIFHHFTTIEGTVYNAGTSHRFIQGVEKGLTLNMRPDVMVLFAQHQGAAIQTPTVTSLMGISDKADVAALTIGATSTYKPPNIILVVPFMLQHVNRAILEESGLASAVMVTVAKAIKDFDTTNSSKPKYRDKAKQKCKDVLSWLYLVATNHDSIEATPVTGCNSKEMVDTLNSIGKACLGEAGISPTKLPSNVRNI